MWLFKQWNLWTNAFLQESHFHSIFLTQKVLPVSLAMRLRASPSLVVLLCSWSLLISSTSFLCPLVSFSPWSTSWMEEPISKSSLEPSVTRSMFASTWKAAMISWSRGSGLKALMLSSGESGKTGFAAMLQHHRRAMIVAEIIFPRKEKSPIS